MVLLYLVDHSSGRKYLMYTISKVSVHYPPTQDAYRKPLTYERTSEALTNMYVSFYAVVILPPPPISSWSPLVADIGLFSEKYKTVPLTECLERQSVR